MEKILGLLKKVNDKLVCVELENNYTEIQKIVGGYFDVGVFGKEFEKNNIDMFFNDEGKINNLDPNIAILNSENEIIDIVVGDVLFLSNDGEGKTIGLSNKQIEIIRNNLRLGTLICEEKEIECVFLKI